MKYILEMVAIRRREMENLKKHERLHTVDIAFYVRSKR